MEKSTDTLIIYTIVKTPGCGAEPHIMLLFVISFVTILRPTEIHFLIVIFYELRYSGNLSVIENPTVLKYCIAIALDEEFC